MPTYKQACNLVAAMIKDAKVDMINAHILLQKRQLTPRESTRFTEARSWLKNGNGGLEDLLSAMRGVHLESALAELKEFAEEGYKGPWELGEAEFRRGQAI